MIDEMDQALQTRTDVIALPPLKMVLVHAKDERKTMPRAATKPAEQQEQVQPQTLKKLIEHLEKNS